MRKPVRLNTRRAALVLALLAPWALQSAHAADQSASSYPDKPVRIVMPFSAGGMGDVVAREVAAALTKEWGQPVVVDNKPGASGMLGNDFVAKSAPDGYTLLVGISQLVMAPSLYSKIPYDVTKDFTPLTRIADAMSAFITMDPQIKSMKDYVALAKAAPDKYSNGTYGTGTSSHIFSELFNLQNGIRTVQVPYKGVAPMMTDMLGGHVTLSFSDLATPLPYIKDGKVKVYAVTGAKRAPLLPDVPTFSELGYKGFEVAGWYGVLGPAKMPPAIAAKIRDTIARIVRTPDMQARFTELGLVPVSEAKEDFAQRMRTDQAYWHKAITETKIRIEQ
jgi:tripartite-type tricarboxylate transporter receptor subunit TctC